MQDTEVQNVPANGTEHEKNKIAKTCSKALKKRGKRKKQKHGLSKKEKEALKGSNRGASVNTTTGHF